MKAPESLRDRAAQLLMPRLGSNMPPQVAAEDDAERLMELMARVPVGGMVLFRGSASKSPPVLDRLQAASRFPLLIGADLERGAGQQLAGATVFPHAMAMGRAGADPAGVVREAARITAVEARSCGVNWLFAPVADVHSNPTNPIIATRAFGSDPGQCGQLAQAWIEGCRAGGALSTAKHFPGHGDTATDSHDELPFVDRDAQDLRAVELAPFRASIAARVDSIMTAHVAYPALDPAGRSATFSAPILRTLLRDELGFKGVVVSDSLLMGGAGEQVSRRAPELVAAGVDVLLDISHPEAALNALVQAVEHGSLREAALDEAFQRVWAMKLRLESSPAVSVRSAAAVDLSRRAAAMALEVEGDPARVLRGEPVVPLILIRPHTDYPDPTRAEAADILARSGRFNVEVLGPDSHESDRALLLDTCRTAGKAVVVMVVKPAAWHRFGLLEEQEALAGDIVRAVPTVLCSLGSPDADSRLPRPAARIVTYSDVETSVAALAHVLCSDRETPNRA